MSRYDRRTGQVQNVSPRPLRGAGLPGRPHRSRSSSRRSTRKSSTSPRTRLWKTTDGGRSWDANQPRPDAAGLGGAGRTWASTGTHPGRRRRSAASSTRSRPRPSTSRRIWAGTDDGLIHVTRDGGTTWKDVTPPALTPWAKVSHHGRVALRPADTAYAAINTFRLDDMRPHIYRTRDGGKTWAHVVGGHPGRRDRRTRCARTRSEGACCSREPSRQVYVSFDDGDHWQSLRLNMPATSIRDLVVKDDDLVVGTHGRGFWILDDITPLRQIDEKSVAAEAHLFRPQASCAVPLEQVTPTRRCRPTSRRARTRRTARSSTTTSQRPASRTGDARDPRRGGAPSCGGTRATIRPEPPVEGRNIPDYWIRPPQQLSHRRRAAPLRLGPALPAAGGGVVLATRFPRSTGTHRASRADPGWCPAPTRSA